MDQLKEALTKTIELSYPIKNGGPFILDMDASDYHIGTALHQIQNGEERLLRFGSRCLNSAEVNYCTTRKELLAVVYFMTYYKHYLLGENVKVIARTDHGSLRWLLNLKNPSGQVARWLEKLACYDFEIQHRPGRLHGNADALSQRPCEGDCPQCMRIFNKMKEAAIQLNRSDESKVIVNLVNVKGRYKKRKMTVNPVAHRVSTFWEVRSMVKAVADDPVLSILLAWKSSCKSQ